MKALLGAFYAKDRWFKWEEENRKTHVSKLTPRLCIIKTHSLWVQTKTILLHARNNLSSVPGETHARVIENAWNALRHAIKVSSPQPHRLIIEIIYEYIYVPIWNLPRWIRAASFTFYRQHTKLARWWMISARKIEFINSESRRGGDKKQDNSKVIRMHFPTRVCLFHRRDVR